MRLSYCFAASLVAIAGCAADSGDPSDPTYTAVPSDFDSKADGIASTSPEVLSLIDAAKTRVLAQLPNITDQKLLQHLTSAAQRGVDVHVYVVVPHAAHPQTVLASEQLEASGVDITVVRKSELAGFFAIGDDSMLVNATGSIKTVTGDAVTTAATTFEGAIAEDTSGNPPSLGSDQTALMLMPDTGAGPLVSLIAGAKSSIDLESAARRQPPRRRLAELQAGVGAARERRDHGQGDAAELRLRPQGSSHPAFNLHNLRSLSH